MWCFAFMEINLFIMTVNMCICSFFNHGFKSCKLCCLLCAFVVILQPAVDRHAAPKKGLFCVFNLPGFHIIKCKSYTSTSCGAFVLVLNTLCVCTVENVLTTRAPAKTTSKAVTTTKTRTATGKSTH